MYRQLRNNSQSDFHLPLHLDDLRLQSEHLSLRNLCRNISRPLASRLLLSVCQFSSRFITTIAHGLLWNGKRAMIKKLLRCTISTTNPAGQEVVVGSCIMKPESHPNQPTRLVRRNSTLPAVTKIRIL